MKQIILENEYLWESSKYILDDIEKSIYNQVGSEFKGTLGIIVTYSDYKEEDI